MKILAFTSLKGGSGKTTLAASIAAAAARDGEKVVCIDTDDQKSLATWGQRREAEDITFRESTPADLRDLLDRVRRHGSTTMVIVDLPGRLGAGVNIVLRDADLCVVPCRPTVLDVEATIRTVDQLRTAGKASTIILNQCLSTAQSRTLEAATVLAKTNVLMPLVVAARTDHHDAMTAGQGVTEVAPNGKAAAEIDAVWAQIKRLLSLKSR